MASLWNGSHYVLVNAIEVTLRRSNGKNEYLMRICLAFRDILLVNKKTSLDKYINRNLSWFTDLLEWT